MKYAIVEPYQSRKLGNTLQEGKNIRILRYRHLHRCEIGLNSFFLDPQIQLISFYFLRALKIFRPNGLHCSACRGICLHVCLGRILLLFSV
jgi:hypothetical protein